METHLVRNGEAAFDLHQTAAPATGDAAPDGWLRPRTGPQPAASAEAGALAIVAHDLKGPLANLMLLVESMAGAARAGACRRIATDVEKAERIIDRLDALLSAVLSKARTFGDPLACRRSAFDIRALLRDLVAANAPLAASRGVGITCRASSQVMVCDRQLIAQALDNLIGNAVKYTRRGGAVRCTLAAEPDGWIAIRIRDEGPGFTPEELGSAFRPFQRLSAKCEPHLPSHGLGLWIVRLVAERHGGKLSVANRTDRSGAEFTLRLPPYTGR